MTRAPPVPPPRRRVNDKIGGIGPPKRGSPMKKSSKPASTWLFEDGTLTVHHLGETVSLGRYATREFAAKAAAAYFAKHGGQQ